MARTIGINQSTLSRIESGSLSPDDNYISGFARALRLTPQELKQLELLALAFRYEFQRWDFEDPRLVAKLQKQVKALEEHSSNLDSLSLHLVAGLLQTRRYSDQLFIKLGLLDGARRAEAVEARQERQARMRASDIKIRFILHENCLSFPVVDTVTLREQRRSLAKWFSESNPRIEARLLTNDLELPVCPLNSFTIYGAQVVSVETLTSSTRRFFPDELVRYQQQFDALWAVALRGAKARRFIKQ